MSVWVLAEFIQAGGAPYRSHLSRPTYKIGQERAAPFAWRGGTAALVKKDAAEGRESRLLSRSVLGATLR